MKTVLLLLASFLTWSVECSLLRFGQLRGQPWHAQVVVNGHSAEVHYGGNTARLMLDEKNNLQSHGSTKSAARIVRGSEVINPDRSKVSLQSGDRVVLGVGEESTNSLYVADEVTKMAKYIAKNPDGVDAMTSGYLTVVAFPITYRDE